MITIFDMVSVEESKNMIKKLGDAPSKDEYKTQSYSLKKFHEILASVAILILLIFCRLDFLNPTSSGNSNNRK
ncbi:MAG: hypothetical protein ACK513_11540 [Aphanizomenon sp.]|nr:hypothetical protein [Aphanizomenon flos-aquae CP01]